MSEHWRPDPEWPPDVQQFTAGLYLYLMTLTPEEARTVMREVAISMMRGVTEEESP